MALDFHGARAEDDDQPFVVAFIRPLVAHVMRPGEAFRPPSVLALDMEVKRLRGMLAFVGERLLFRPAPFSSMILFRNLLLVSGITHALPGRASNRQ